MLHIGTVVVGVQDMGRAADFWTRALGYVVCDGQVEDDWTVLVPVDRSGVGLALQRSETPVQERPRVHLDLYAGDAPDQAAEVERDRHRSRLTDRCVSHRSGTATTR